MKIFNSKVEKTMWLYILVGIPIGVLILWKHSGTFGLTETIILLFSLAVAVLILYLIKWTLKR
ncbi:MAG: hypothetical protein WBI53_01430 [Paludibacter sp.]